MTKIELIKNTFNKLDEKFKFLTLRNFHDIPDNSSCDNDIDIIIKKEDYDAVHQFMKDLGYDVYYDNTLPNINVVHKYIYEAKSHLHAVNRKIDVHFDIVCGLYYRSLEDRNIFVGGFESLENSLWDNKFSVNTCYKYRTSDEDLLNYLVCHCIFDKRQVTSKYEKIILELYSKSDKDKLKELFDLSFYKASDHVLSVIESGNISNLFTDYTQYSNY